MTAFFNEGLHSDMTNDVQVWRCESCKCVHIRAGNILLTFTTEEYCKFTEAVVDCSYSESFFGLNQQMRTDDSLPILVSEMES